MSVKAKIGNIQFEFDNEADLRMFLAATAKNGVGPAQPVDAAPPALGQRLKKIYDKLKTKQKQQALILALTSAPEDGMTDQALREALGLRSNNELAGTVAGLSKNMASAGLSLEHVLVKNKLPQGGYQYRLTLDMRDVVGKSRSRAKTSR